MKKDLGYVKGPKGDTGPQGAVGPQGAKGEKGDPARVCGKLAGADGNIQLVAADVGGLSAEQINALLLNKANSIGAISQAQFDSLNYSHTIFGCIGPWVTGHPRENDYGIIELGAYGLDTHLPNGMQEITYTNGDRYYRKAVNGSISRWFKIATATPPEEHALPLMDGWMAGRSRTKFSISQNSLVLVTFGVSGPANTSDRAVIAQLPPGFRPGELISTECIVTEPQTYTRYAAGLDVNRAGEVIVFSKQPGWTIAVGQVAFYTNV